MSSTIRAGLMRRVGLIPTDTGAPGGKETGQQVTHYIEPGGAFERACAALMAEGFVLPYVELWGEADGKTRKKKAASKSKYTCETCGANAWAKPESLLICGACFDADEGGEPVTMKMEAPEGEGDD